jgi:membrane-associated phospholipid phosphatase
MNEENTISLTERKSFALPIFLTKQNKYFYSGLWVLIGGSLYMFSNHNPLFTPQLLPMTWIDKAVPFLPWTYWIYTSEFFLFFSVYIVCKDLVNANKYLYSFLTLQIISVAIFMVWPTTYPRDLYPMPASVDWLTAMCFGNLRSLDTPGNCAPSLHVSSVYLSSFLYLDEQREKFPFFFGWATFVAISTLTTKQHYLIDVVSGLGMAIVLYYIFHRVVKYRQ